MSGTQPRSPGSTPWLRFALAAAAAAIALVALARWLAPPEPPALPTAPVPAAEPEPVAAAEPSSAEPAPELAGPDLPAIEDDLSRAWEQVDLEAVRRELPDNLYWELAAPTDDPRILEERERERAYWNDQYGKVLSGQASEEEIDAYYAHRQRVSADYVEFSNYMFERYKDVLSGQDLTLFALASRLHLARLEEIPRKLEEARARKRTQDEARAAWLEEQAEFEGGDEAEAAEQSDPDSSY